MWNEDISLVKTTPLTEKLKLSLFVFAINALNHVNPGDPGVDITSPNLAGVITSVRSRGDVAQRRLVLGVRLEF